MREGTGEGVTMKCEICKENELSLHCTMNVCEECCKSGRCTLDDKCVARNRRKLIEASINMFIIGLKLNKWLQYIEPIVLGDLTEEQVAEISKEIDAEIDKVIEEIKPSGRCSLGIPCEDCKERPCELPDVIR